MALSLPSIKSAYLWFIAVWRELELLSIMDSGAALRLYGNAVNTSL
ncbi:hypothetical protein B5T_01903 [Alloalcanivorax dieselolei B5]|uniref:Uncharacterized protein n=1 Tax=Alcanivorax dieselolei (strain DSM 16502 / CGMCC 1.3690 / MCCC 1A00001 / B-5) TaxID=930169 RepID=K0CC89_ALCDB|nr:hypothetical protein B5T_01903 [Alloalcanivorax dieselolei B5]